MKVFRNLMRGVVQALPGGLALAANLLVAGVPAIHAWAHHAHPESFSARPVVPSVTHSHEDVHPDALHDDWRLAKRISYDYAVTVSLTLQAVAVPTTVEIVDHTILALESRGPPGPGVARSPPT